MTRLASFGPVFVIAVHSDLSHVVKTDVESNIQQSVQKKPIDTKRNAPRAQTTVFCVVWAHYRHLGLPKPSSWCQSYRERKDY
jgi:hypothetical protein